MQLTISAFVGQGLFFALTLAAASARAEDVEPEQKHESTSPRRAPFTGPEWDFEHANFIQRAAVDLIAIPAGMPWWSLGDWAKFAGAGVAVGGLMVPVNGGPSVDVRLQDWINTQRPDVKRTLWSPVGDVAIWTGIWGATVGLHVYGHLEDKPRFREGPSLMTESLIVANLYQVVMKLSLGREGPENGEGQGRIHGPLHGWRLFPSGTPSGHAASLYGMIGVVDAYWRNPWVSLAVHTFGVAFGATITYDNYHFISDVLWGAAMGYAIGQWTVRHRAVHRPEENAVLSSLRVAPYVQPGSGRYGVAASVSF